MATMKDVARRAGVSVATVSCCLSGRKNVRPETRLRIEQAVHDLKYVPNPSAQRLKGTRSRTVGAIMPDFNEQLFSGIFKGISEYFQGYRFNVRIAFSNGNPRKEQELISDFAHENLAGLALITCQPENAAFFSQWMRDYDIPIVFCHQRPVGLEADYAGFDNRCVACAISSALLRAGVCQQAIIMGDERLPSEAEFLQGVRDAYTAEGKRFPHEQRYITSMTKEDAFKTAMHLVNLTQVPRAILCTSPQITKGVIEVLRFFGIRVPEDVIVVTLDEESWNDSNHLPGVIYTSRSADDLGRAAARMLLTRMEGEKNAPPQTYIMQDRFLHKPLKLPPMEGRAAYALPVHASHVIRVVCAVSPSIPLLENLSQAFTLETGVRFEFTQMDPDGIMNVIKSHRPDYTRLYDALIYDVPWLEELVRIEALDDMTDLIERKDFRRERILNCDWESHCYMGRYYGLPIVNGAQTLFYRRDLFERPDIMEAYYKKYRSMLRPPRYWKEYDRIARFFTREFNPASPTKWGIAESDCNVGSLIVQNYSRFLSAGGQLWDRYGRPRIDTPENREALEFALGPYRFVKNKTSNLDMFGAVNSFCQGEVAMYISFNDTAFYVSDAINKNVIGQLGYALPPEGRSIRAGWGLGINPRTPFREDIYRYLKWLLRTDISYYYTILSGQSTSKLPYENSEILNLYPWMALHPHGEMEYSARLTPPNMARDAYVPYFKVESIFAQILRDVLLKNRSVAAALQHGQAEMKALFRAPEGERR